MCHLQSIGQRRMGGCKTNPCCRPVWSFLKKECLHQLVKRKHKGGSVPLKSADLGAHRCHQPTSKHFPSPFPFPNLIHFLGYVFSFSRPDDSLMCSRLSLLSKCPRSKQCFCDQKSPLWGSNAPKKMRTIWKKTSWLLRLYMRADTGYLMTGRFQRRKPKELNHENQFQAVTMDLRGIRKKKMNLKYLKRLEVKRKKFFSKHLMRPDPKTGRQIPKERQLTKIHASLLLQMLPLNVGS